MITVIIKYKGSKDKAKMFARDMLNSGTVKKIREEEGNLGYKYFTPYDDPEAILLVNFWENQDSLDRHHNSPIMGTIRELKEKYDLYMTVERYEASL